jgi:hypothetical protein
MINMVYIIRIKSEVKTIYIAVTDNYNVNKKQRRINMKLSSKLMIALTLTLALGLVGVNAWAAPSRQGTVPPSRDTTPIEGIIPVTGACYKVTLAEGCDSVGTVKRFNDPGKQIGAANDGFEFLTWAVQIDLEGECKAVICFPYPPEDEERNADIYKWNPLTKSWDAVDSKVSGDPKEICVVEDVDKDTAYALFGN